MVEVTDADLGEVEIAGRRIGSAGRIRRYQPGEGEFEFFTTTVWSVPKRGRWATHRSDYRGNWAPQIVRNILLRYSEEKDVVPDQFMGGGTTLVECKLTGRNGIGVDMDPDAVAVSGDRLDFGKEGRLDGEEDLAALPPYEDGFGELRAVPRTFQRTYVGDARSLDRIGDGSVDLVATHPPYADIINYSGDIEGDLSRIHDTKGFLRQMRATAKEVVRVLKPGKFCAVLIGDIRRRKFYIPLSARVMEVFSDQGLRLREDIIKRQWRCKTTGFWTKRSIDYNFLLIMHEHLYVFKKV